MHSRSTMSFVIAKGLCFQLRATHLRMLTCTSMILRMLLKDDQKGMKFCTRRLYENHSAMNTHCNPFASIYCHTYEILRSNESSNTNSEDRSNSDGSAESGSSYITVGLSIRIRLTERGDRRTYSLPTMEEFATVTPIEYSERSFRDIVLTLSQTHAAYKLTHYTLLFPHRTHS